VHGRTTPATPDDVPIPDAAGMDADWLNCLMTASQIVPWGRASSRCSRSGCGRTLSQPAPLVQLPPGRGHQLAPRPQAVTLGKPVRQHIITVSHRPPPPPDTPRPATTRGNQHKNHQHNDLRLEY
jgi:hypothetical protein